MSNKIRVVYAKDSTAGKRGTPVEIEPADFAVLSRDGIVVTEGEWNAVQAREATDRSVRATNKVRYEATVKAAVAAAKQRGAIPPADTKVEETALAQIAKVDNGRVEDQETVFDVVKASIDGLQHPEFDRLAQRFTKPTGDQGLVYSGGRIELGVSLADASKEYVRCSEPMDRLVKAGDLKSAVALSRERSLVVQQHVAPLMRADGDFMLRDMVKAADYTDPNSQVGTLATGLIVMRNLGFLKNKLPWMPYFTTDLKAEPLIFGRPVITRYITPPGVLTYVPGVGFTSDATTISNASAGTNQSGVQTQTSGTVTKSVPSTTDVTITINQFKGVEIEFPITTLGATARNLFAEQRGAQLYALAEHINLHVLKTIFAATWSGTVTSFSLGAQMGLPTMVNLKNRMTLAKIPDMGRVALMHSVYHDNLLVDGNLLTAKAILSLLNKNASEFEQSEVPSLFGVKPLESQLASYTAANVQTAPTIAADGTNVDFASPGITKVGFAGNMSSMLFAARVPQDFTQAAKDLGIPASSAVEIVTEPDTGLTVMVFKYVDNGKMSVSCRVCLMYGAAQGDPRVGIVLTP